MRMKRPLFHKAWLWQAIGTHVFGEIRPQNAYQGKLERVATGGRNTEKPRRKHKTARTTLQDGTGRLQERPRTV